MVALEFLVLSVIVRIGVEQHPLPPEFCFPRRTLFSKQCLYDTAFFVSNSFLIISSGRLHPLKMPSNLTRTYTRLRMARRLMKSVAKRCGAAALGWGKTLLLRTSWESARDKNVITLKGETFRGFGCAGTDSTNRWIKVKMNGFAFSFMAKRNERVWNRLERFSENADYQ